MTGKPEEILCLRSHEKFVKLFSGSSAKNKTREQFSSSIRCDFGSLKLLVSCHSTFIISMVYA